MFSQRERVLWGWLAGTSLIVYSVIVCILWATLSCKHMWGKVPVIWMILVCVTYTHFIYHPTLASCSEIHYSKTWWDKNLNKYTWLFWQFPDIKVQPGSHSGRHICHYKSHNNVLATCVQVRQRMCVIHAKNVCKSQNSMKPCFSISNW